MGKPPSSLTSLCIDAVRDELLRGDDLFPVVYQLPSNLFDFLVARLSPLMLRKLQMCSPADFDDRSEDEEYEDWGYGGGRKRRRRHSNFEKAWRDLFQLRWPEYDSEMESVDWQQTYWECHLQSCLDEAVEVALLPSFDGSLGDISIAESILKHIGFRDPMNACTSDYMNLSYHFQEFGIYARYLCLQNVLCRPETSYLLRTCKLRSLVLRWIRSDEQIDGLCKLLRQNCDSLSSLEFVYCKFSSDSIDEICGALIINSVLTHGIQNFSISTSKFHETNPASLPPGLVSFLSGRSLRSLSLPYNHLAKNFANMVYNTLCDVSSSVSDLDLSENNITGWLSNFNQSSSQDKSASPELGKCLKLLRVLKLRGNNLDTDDVIGLKKALGQMPNLEALDISDNPIEDDGIRILLPYFVEASEKLSPLSELHVENCELSVIGMTELMNTLSTLKRPLKILSIADNVVGSQVASALGKLLSTAIEELNISGIGMGSLGFEDLKRSMSGELELVEINISKNRGGFAAAEFLCTLLSRAPKLVSVNAAYNFMPVESTHIITSAIKALKGNLELLDLSGNNFDSKTIHGLAEISRKGRPALICPLFQTFDEPYDVDP